MTRADRKKLIIYLLIIIYAIFQLISGKNNPQLKVFINPTNVPTPTFFIGKKQAALVTRVIDGDTIEIEGEIKVRYIGINSPEIEQCFANESYLENKKLVEGKKITMIKDVSDKGKYGRLLRYVYVDDQFVNEYLIKNGFAKLMTIKPDIKYSLQFKADQAEAKVNNLGIWKACPSTK